MSRISDEVDQKAEMDMTPMIDCVFLLMIFFVLVIDLSQKDLEDLILPKAKYAVPDENPPDVRPIVNITQDGRVVYRKNVRYNPATDGENYEGIRNLLLEWKETVVQDVEPQVVAGRQVTIVNDPILIRADKWTEWHYVGKFMTGCSQPEAAFWKLELAMSEQDKEEKLYRGK
ncbi:MAG: biopolymer transporter ExbD [Planctomycetes bacterium]|nr:biopolymer transporter ExbD [Planctomycetota bacterium]